MDASRSKLATSIAVFALVAGLAADLLLRTDAWGINFSIFTVLIVAGALFVSRGQDGADKGTLWLLVPTLCFGALFAWRDSYELKIANFIGLSVSALLLAERLKVGRLWSALALDYSAVIMQRVFELPTHAWRLVAKEIPWTTSRTAARKGAYTAMARGAILTLPLVLVFGGLLAKADSVFESTISTAFDFDGTEVWLNVLTILGAAVLVAGLMARALLVPASSRIPHKKGLLGSTEASIVLASLNVLFALFVFVQIRYLFGGSGVVRLTEGLTYAEYARQGFFELVAVAGLVVPLLLTLNSVVADGPDKRRVIWMSRSMVLLVLVIVASALVRMSAYVDAYGLTMLRLYTSAFMCWLAMVFLWILFATLWRRERMMPFGAVLSGWVCILALNVLNPDGLMARVNTRMANLDAAYLTGLSADAVPDVVAALPNIAPAKRKVLQEWINTEWSGLEEDWREWNLGRAAARISTSSPSSKSSH